jgi:glutamyl-tRNA reductase
VHYVLVSFSHKNSDISVRERLSFDMQTQEKFLINLTHFKCISEAVLISTCNRMEVVVNTAKVNEAIEKIFETLSEFSSLGKNELEGRADIFEDEGAIKHLFSVAGALESLVVGENQILGQLRESCNFAKSKGFCKKKLDKLFNFAFRCAAEIKSVTDIGKNPVSVASAAVAQAKEILNDLKNYSAIIFGTGEMGTLAAKHLINAGAEVIMVGRDLEKTKLIAKDINEKIIAAPYSDIVDLINSYRLFFSATGAPHPLITNDMVKKRDFERVWFDLGLPRDIEIEPHHNIKLFKIDDLQEIVQKNMSLRSEEASKAFSIVGKYTNEFFKYLETLSVDPIIKAIRKEAQMIVKEEIKKAINKKYLPKELEDSFVKTAHSIFKRFLHKPTVFIKEIADKPEADDLIENVKRLFDIKEDKLKLVPKKEDR